MWDFFGKKPQILMIPIYSTTILYDMQSECVHWRVQSKKQYVQYI